MGSEWAEAAARALLSAGVPGLHVVHALAPPNA
jgi:hypothetical protein